MYFSETPVEPHIDLDVNKERVREVIRLKKTKNNIRRATYLLRYKEAYNVVTAEMDSAHGLKKNPNRLKNELQQVLHF